LKALLDCSDGAFHIANMAIRRDNVHFNRAKLFTDAGKLIVGIDAAYGETSGAVEVDSCQDLK
jgi:hypothetical protein